ncbi:hypothetical protein, partial [Klebsiella pneumoniae]|uniref:hypothetical protein n=1 Tax=Klebsiella pneumoniae TaxID=573 RepID=UPI003A84A04D
AAGFVVLSGVAIAIGVFWLRAVGAAHRAEASKLLALAQLKLRDDATEALALTGASLREADTPEARQFVMKVLWESPPALLEPPAVPGPSTVTLVAVRVVWLPEVEAAPCAWTLTLFTIAQRSARVKVGWEALVEPPLLLPWMSPTKVVSLV